MIDRQRFEKIKARHGGYASWAVWADAAAKPKSNVGDLSVLDPDTDSSLLDVLRDDVVMVGLNISRSFSEAFRNFHDPSARANDFKIRYAFKDTAYYGGYMTDVIKNVEMVSSADLLKLLRLDPSLIRDNVATFLEELADLGANNPTILAFGSAAHKLLAASIPTDAYARLVKLTHYSHRIGKEQYRQAVLEQLRVRPSATSPRN
jgi:hypothetical protein